MEYALTPHTEAIEHYAWWSNQFNNEELDWLQNHAKNYQEKAMVGGGSAGRLNSDVRRAGLNWMPCVDDTLWVFQKLSKIVSTLNAQYFRFNLSGFGESIQLTNYDSCDMGMYGWHIDMNTSFQSPCRKLSLVMQLSHPNDYEGGELELITCSSKVIKIEKQRGLIVVFPSWTLHQVTPVIKGNRQSLVSWITGPQFK